MLCSLSHLSVIKEAASISGAGCLPATWNMALPIGDHAWPYYTLNCALNVLLANCNIIHYSPTHRTASSRHLNNKSIACLRRRCAISFFFFLKPNSNLFLITVIQLGCLKCFIYFLMSWCAEAIAKFPGDPHHRSDGMQPIITPHEAVDCCGRVPV